MGSMAAASRALRISAVCTRTLPAARPGERRNLTVQATTEAGKLKSIDDLPGPSLSTTLYWLFVKGYADKSHLLQVQNHSTVRCSLTYLTRQHHHPISFKQLLTKSQTYQLSFIYLWIYVNQHLFILNLFIY